MWIGFKTASGALWTPPPTRLALPPYFSNLLPEGHLRDYLAARGSVNPAREFFLLGLLGGDLSGAIVVRSEREGPAPSVAPGDADHDVPHALRFSLAGVQLKFSALAEARGGLTIPAGGAGGDWIIKLPSAQFADVPLHEHALLDIAEATGLTVPEHRLIPLESIRGLPNDLGPLTGQALAVRRFDREPDGTLTHIEDFAQVFRVYAREKYERASSENIGRVLWAECGLATCLEFVRRLTFIVLTGNADMHLKNWSLRYADRRTPDLSPAYDLVGTVAFLPDDKLGLSLGGEREMRRVTLETFDRFAARVGLPIPAVRDTVVETVRQFFRVWREHPAVSTLPYLHLHRLDAHASSVPLARLDQPRAVT